VFRLVSCPDGGPAKLIRDLAVALAFVTLQRGDAAVFKAVADRAFVVPAWVRPLPRLAVHTSPLPCADVAN